MPIAESLLLGVDAGTTELKVAVFGSRTGRCRSFARHRLPVRAPEPGAREQDPAALLHALRRAAARLRKELGGAWKKLAGVGLAAQGGSAMALDPSDGRAWTPMQLWNDARPLPLGKKLAARRPPGYWRRLSRLDGPGAGLARMLWMQERDAGCFRNRIYGGAGEFLYFHLTGRWLQDPGNALQMGCYSVARRVLVEDPLTLAGLTLDQVAPLRSGHEQHPLSAAGGRLLGLPEGLPVVGPYIDQEAGFLSAAGHGERPAQCSLGTAWVANFSAPRPPRRSAHMDLVLPSPLGSGCLVLRVMRAGNVTWDWTTGLFNGHAPPGDLLPPDGLVAFPWLTRPNAHWPAANGNGAWLGIGPHVEGKHLVRAAEAALAFEFRSLFEPFPPSTVADGLVLTGGASRSHLCNRLLAGLFHPLSVWRATEPACCGARGAVFALSRRAARVPVRRVSPPPRGLHERLVKQYAHYLALRGIFFKQQPQA